MKKKRAYGTGSIEPSGRGFRVRVRVAGKRRDLGTYPTEAKAEQVRRGFLAEQSDGRMPRQDLTLAEWGEDWLDARERSGNRAVANDRNRWKNHIATAYFASWPIKDVGRRDVKAWLSRLPGEWQTRKHCLNLLRRSFADALEDEVVTMNPAMGVRLTKPSGAGDKWTYLLPEEQMRLATCEVDRQTAIERLIALVAIGTGLRQGELWNLELVDVHADDPSPWLYVRWGSKGLPPKNKKHRRVDLFGVGLLAVQAWLSVLKEYAPRNRFKLFCPTPRGYRRQRSKLPKTWDALTHTARLDRADVRHDRRPVRWHDLRHTCASSLVAGWWGRVWTLQEVRDLLGHSSITVTERYAHLHPGVIAAAALATSGPNLARSASTSNDETGLFQLRARRDSNARPSASEADTLSS